MNTVFASLNSESRQPLVYISREQFADAYYIPSEANIIIVDFKEDDNDNRAEDTESN